MQKKSEKSKIKKIRIKSNQYTRAA